MKLDWVFFTVALGMDALAPELAASTAALDRSLSDPGGNRLARFGARRSFASSAASMARRVQGRRYDDLQWATEMGAYPIKTGS